MKRFLRMLLMVAAPALFMSTAHADGLDNRARVHSGVIDVMEIPLTDKILTTIVIKPNEHQV